MTTIVDEFAKLKNLEINSKTDQHFWSIRKINSDDGSNIV